MDDNKAQGGQPGCPPSCAHNRRCAATDRTIRMAIGQTCVLPERGYLRCHLAAKLALRNFLRAGTIG